MNNESYLRQAQGRGERYSNAVGNRFNAAGVGTATPNRMWNQAAGAPMGEMPTSSPYILTISAASNTAQTTISLFFANKNVNGFQYASDAAGLANASGPGFYLGSWYPAAGIKVTSNFETYQQLLIESQTNRFQIGKTLLIAASGADTISQVQTPINYTRKFPNGSTRQDALIFVFDIAQQIQSQTVNKDAYILDGNSGLDFTLLAAGAAGSVNKLFVYPTINFDPSQALVGGSALNSYSAPQSPLSPVVIR